MSGVTKKRKYLYFPKRHESLDYGYDMADEQNGKPMVLQRFKSIDEGNDSTDLEPTADIKQGVSASELDKHAIGNVKNSVTDQIKLAAIYDNDGEIIRILQSETNMDDVQNILARNDERGQPCIFYALESRSQKALATLLCHVRYTQCVIAANGESVLHVATKMGDIDILRNLLEQDFVVDLVDHVERENGRAPLHLAARFNHIEIAKELLQHGAKLDREDITGKSPLYIAASGGHADMLKVFLEHAKDRVEDLLFSTKYGRSVYKNILHVAVSSGDERSVQVCLDQDPEVVRRYLEVEVKHGDGYLIHAACKNGMEKCLYRIVESMGHLDTLQLNRKDKLGFTPIHKAAFNNHCGVVRFIGRMSKRFVNETTEHSQTALILATQRGHIEVVKQLLELKADFTTRDDSQRTVLHYAIAYPQILKILLKKKDLAQMLINAKEKDGYSPVHNAALRGLSESVHILLECGADLNVFTNTSRSPLHCAVSSQCLDVVELVLANEPALVNKADATGKTPLHTAASYGNCDVVKTLLDNGALIIRDENLFSALHIAAHKGHTSIVETLVAFDRNVIDWVNKYGRTALLTAACACKSDVVKFLLNSQAAITEDYEFYNCLDWSLIKNDEKSAMMMICDDRWQEIMKRTKHGTEGTMSKLVYSMPEVAHRALSNSMKSVGHPDTKEHLIRYNFMCLQNQGPDNKKPAKLKPLTAIKTMVRTNCYRCLCHPVCCKYLKAKWMDFGWKMHSVGLIVYLMFLISLNVYAFGIPSYKESQKSKGDQQSSINAKVAMVFCLVFASVNTLKEIAQLAVYKWIYFLDKVNYLECVLYVSTFIFAVPVDGEVAVKSTTQWKACSIALFCTWLNLVMNLRRFASYGIIVLMMRRISYTLIKVLVLLIFFLVAFAAAFTVVMNDRNGFETFGIALLTSATMTLGEFDFKETFLDDQFADYSTFYWLRIVHLAMFLIIMPIIIMNLLLALAIDDTNSIMQQAKLQKHIQTAKMIIDLERKRSRFPWWRPRLVPVLEERPNKKHDFSRTIWEFVFYGPDFSQDQELKTNTAHATNENLSRILNMMKELQKQNDVLQKQNAILQNKMSEIQNEFTSERNRRSLEMIRLSQDRHHAGTQFRGYSESIDQSAFKVAPVPEVPPELMTADTKRKVWGGVRSRLESGSQPSGGVNFSDIVKSAEQDVLEDKEREKKENDPELKELKDLHNKVEEYDDLDGDDGEETVEHEESTPLNVEEPNHRQRVASVVDDDNNVVVA